MERYTCYRSKSVSPCYNNFPSSKMKLNLNLNLVSFGKLGEKTNQGSIIHLGYGNNSQVSVTLPDDKEDLNEYPAPKRESVIKASAINDLDDFISPRCPQIAQNSLRGTNIENSSEIRNTKYKLPETFNLSSNYKTETAEYYKEQLKRVTLLLNAENKKNSDALFSIAILEKGMNQLEATLQEQKKKAYKIQERYNELQELFKKQTIINLELEVVLSKMILQQKQKEQNLKFALKNDLQLSAIIQKLQKQNQAKEADFRSKIRQLQAKFEAASALDKRKIKKLQHSLNQREQSMNLLKAIIKVKGDIELSKEKVGNSTTPSHVNDDCETRLNQEKCQQPNMKGQKSYVFSKPQNQEELPRKQSLDEILKLKSDIFGENKTSLRSYSKTDRI